MLCQQKQLGPKRLWQIPYCLWEPPKFDTIYHAVVLVPYIYPAVLRICKRKTKTNVKNDWPNISLNYLCPVDKSILMVPLPVSCHVRPGVTTFQVVQLTLEHVPHWSTYKIPMPTENLSLNLPGVISHGLFTVVVKRLTSYSCTCNAILLEPGQLGRVISPDP